MCEPLMPAGAVPPRRPAAADRPRGTRVLAVLALLSLLVPQLAAAQDWRTTTASRQRSGENMLRVDVEYAAGSLTLGAAAAGTLYRSSLRYDAETFTPRLAFADNRLRVGVEASSVRGRSMRSGSLDLKLSPDVPLDLELKFGAAEASLDLGGLRLRGLNVQTGASSTTLAMSTANPEACGPVTFQAGAAKFEATGLGNLNTAQLRVSGGVGEVILDFGGAWRRDMTANVEMGLGSLVLRLPRSLGVRIERGGLLTSFDGQEMIRRGNAYYSQNWDSASRRLTLQVDAALGSIKVVWAD